MSDFEPGRLVRIALDVHRLVAPNPSLLTGPGTNTYLLGEPARAVIDPGPADAAHVAAILSAAPTLALIFLTHTHPDHAGAARELKRRSGARVLGRAAPASGPQDRTCPPDREVRDGELFALGCGGLTAIATPGHASNHVCYLLASCGLLFSGDHVLEGVTPVIAPPDGALGDYLDSLRRLRRAPLRAIAPGHGGLLERPHAVIDGILAHRAWREQKVLRALEMRPDATLGELLGRVYDDVPATLHQLASQSLEAHLLKLLAEGRCEQRAERWRVRDTRAVAIP